MQTMLEIYESLRKKQGKGIGRKDYDKNNEILKPMWKRRLQSKRWKCNVLTTENLFTQCDAWVSVLSKKNFKNDWCLINYEQKRESSLFKLSKILEHTRNDLNSYRWSVRMSCKSSQTMVVHQAHVHIYVMISRQWVNKDKKKNCHKSRLFVFNFITSRTF